MIKDNYLERSHPSCSVMSLLVTYLLLAMIISSVVVGISLLNEPTVEIVNGSPFVTDIPGLGRIAKADLSQWEEQPRRGFIGWVRLVPVPDEPKSQTKVPSEVYSLGREDQDGSALPAFYCRIFSEVDLMSRLEMGTTYYTIYR